MDDDIRWRRWRGRRSPARSSLAAFERLSFTHRREYAQWVAEAKREETRARRVAQTLERLKD